MPLRCLIVDDNRSFLEAAAHLLRQEGVEVVALASNSEEAIHLARQLTPDVMLIDIDLGDESGFELVRRLHAEERLPASKVVLISTHAEEDFADLIAESQAIGFLAKSNLSAGALRNLVGGR